MSEWGENIDVNEDDITVPVDENLSQHGVAAMQGVDDAPPEGSSRDAQQIGEATNRLGQFDEIKPEIWQRLEEPERLAALQQVENEMADVQSRPSVEVVADEMGEKSFGYFDGERMHVSADALRSDNVSENVDTVIHEGRHAYQQYAIDHPGFHHDSAEVEAWNENMEDYLSVQMYGQEAYQNQPVESDAWDYASQIRQDLYGEGE